MTDSKVKRGRTPHVSQNVATDENAVSADALASATDQLNATFAKLERRLKSFGVSAMVILPIGDPFEDHETHRLEFGKHGGAWRLMYVTATPDNFGERTEEIPLVTASRSVRVTAAERVNELVQALRTKAAEELQSVRGAIANLESAMAELPEPPSADDFDSDEFGDVPF